MSLRKKKCVSRIWYKKKANDQLICFLSSFFLKDYWIFYNFTDLNVKINVCLLKKICVVLMKHFEYWHLKLICNSCVTSHCVEPLFEHRNVHSMTVATNFQFLKILTLKLYCISVVPYGIVLWTSKLINKLYWSTCKWTVI